MAIYGKKISELEEMLHPTGEEFIPIQDGNTNKKIKAESIGGNEIEVNDGAEPKDSVELWVDLSDEDVSIKVRGDAKKPWTKIPYISALPSNLALSLNVTPLYSSMSNQQALDTSFYNELVSAIENNYILYISDKSTQGVVVNLLVVYINKQENVMKFSCFDGQTSFILLLNTQTKIVSLDTERIGAEFSVFNNTSGLNIFNLEVGATADQIIPCFTDARGEERIPDTGDIFNVHENSSVSDSGIVTSKTEDASGIHIHIEKNNFEYGMVDKCYFKFAYNASQGLDSLRLEEKVIDEIDFSKLSSTKMTALEANLSKGLSEINEFNITAINGAQYDNIQSAISALNQYLGSRPKFIGIKVTFVKNNRYADTWGFMGQRFTDPKSWLLLDTTDPHILSGNTMNRPESVKEMFSYFDTERNKVIWKSKSSSTGWIDANGVNI